MRYSGIVFGPCTLSELSGFLGRLERIYGDITVQDLVDHLANVGRAKSDGGLLDSFPVH